MSLWRRFVQWLVSRELREERELLDARARLLWGTPPRPPGTAAELTDALSEACRQSVPVYIKWSIERRVVEDLPAHQIRIVIEQPGFPRRAA